MSRKLPEYDLKNTIFLVDVKNMELREKENPSNVISFGAMYDYRTSYILEYDPLTKNARPKDYSFPDEERQKGFVLVPQMTELDPEGVAEKYGLSLEQVKSKCDYELWMAKHGERQRIDRNWLPLLDINGVAHVVSVRCDHIYPQHEPMVLGIKLTGIADDLQQHTLYYNVRNFQQYHPKPNMTKLPKDVYQITIPGPGRLDPVGLARKHKLPPEAYLSKYPLVMYRKINLVPLEQTGLAELVRKNLENKVKRITRKRIGN